MTCKLSLIVNVHAARQSIQLRTLLGTNSNMYAWEEKADIMMFSHVIEWSKSVVKLRILLGYMQ